MLCRSIAQPVRHFEPAAVAHPAGAAARTICDLCAKEVFNKAPFRSLQATTEDAVAPSSPRPQYSRVARSVHEAMLAGCRWCTVIGNAVLTSSELNYWASRWEGSRSDGESMSGDSEEEEESSGDEGGDVEEHDVDIEDACDNDHERPGFLTIRALDCAATLEVAIEFLRWGSSEVFNLAKVAIEVRTSSDDEDCALQEMVGDNAISMTLEVISTDMPDGIFSRHWDVVSAASPEAWAPRAAAWLDSCRNEHVQCAMSHSPGAGNGGGFQPTRLIDVRDPMRPRLVTTANFESGEIQPYATLSYVWGPGQSYVLLSDSVAEMHEQLDLSRLPKTIADAIEVARHLGLDYIWIDALCIIQDSPDDKARELPLMADIYRNGAVSVVAAVAASASEGFLREPESAKFLVQPFDIDLGVADGAPSSLTFGYRDPYKASADPISSRAWTLQERVLAPRLLIFSRTGVMWMCREHFANPSAAPDAGPPYQTSLGFAAGAGADGKPVDDDMMRESWMAIRADYTEMDLTYCSDKLPAISALAAEVARRTGWTYVAGLWLENLFSELHWRCMKAERPSLSLDDGDSSLQLKPPKVREAGYLAPSWSWASIGLGMIVDSEGERLDREAFHFRIVRCEVDHAGFQYGPVTGGFLEVEGRLVELDWQSRDEPDWYGTDILLVDPLGKGPEGKPLFLGDGTLDPLDEPLSQAEPLVCLSMSKLKFGRQPITPIEGLLLYPKTPESGGNVFRRIGFFRITGVSIFDQAPSRRMRIE